MFILYYYTLSGLLELSTPHCDDLQLNSGRVHTLHRAFTVDVIDIIIIIIIIIRRRRRRRKEGGWGR